MSQSTQARSVSSERVSRSQRVHQTNRRRAKAHDVPARLSWGPTFCGWCAAVGLTVLLSACVFLAGAAIVLSHGGGDFFTKNAAAFCLMGGVCLVFCLSFAFYVGGYVAGRMARFEGGRHGLGVWLWGVAIATVLGVTVALTVVNYNLYEGFSVHRLPLSGGELIASVGGVLIVSAAVTLGAAIHGGRLGARLHGIIDLAGAAQG